MGRGGVLMKNFTMQKWVRVSSFPRSEANSHYIKHNYLKKRGRDKGVYKKEGSTLYYNENANYELKQSQKELEKLYFELIDEYEKDYALAKALMPYMHNENTKTHYKIQTIYAFFCWV